MMKVFYIFVVIFGILGIIVNTLGVISMYRFKDFYVRMHGSTKCATLGTIFTALSAWFYVLVRLVQSGEGRYWVLIIHIIFCLFTILLANATGAHVLARAAYRAGILPKDVVVDDLAEYESKVLKSEAEEDAAEETAGKSEEEGAK